MVTYRAHMDIPAEQDISPVPDTPVESAPWGINPNTGRPYTKSPEERREISDRLARARTAKAEARRQAAPAGGGGPVPDAEQLAPIDRSGGDQEPGKGRRRGRARRSADRPEQPVPPFKAGPIAKGMNRLYAKAGKIIRTVHPALGEAWLACTRKESDDDTTVGEAWEELARHDPVWRARLLKLCTGGAWGQVFWAHAPILLALLMLEPIRKRMPFPDLVDAVLSDDQGAPADPYIPSGADLQQAMMMATQMMGGVMGQRLAGPGVRQPPQAWVVSDDQAAADESHLADYAA